MKKQQINLPRIRELWKHEGIKHLEEGKIPVTKRKMMILHELKNCFKFKYFEDKF